VSDSELGARAAGASGGPPDGGRGISRGLWAVVCFARGRRTQANEGCDFFSFCSWGGVGTARERRFIRTPGVVSSSLFRAALKGTVFAEIKGHPGLPAKGYEKMPRAQFPPEIYGFEISDSELL